MADSMSLLSSVGRYEDLEMQYCKLRAHNPLIALGFILGYFCWGYHNETYNYWVCFQVNQMFGKCS